MYNPCQDLDKAEGRFEAKLLVFDTIHYFRIHKMSFDDDCDVLTTSQASRHFKESIIDNWTFLKRNIEPMSIAEDVQREFFVGQTTFHNLGSKSRSHQADLVLIEVHKKIKTKSDVKKFLDLLKKSSPCCERKLNDQVIRKEECLPDTEEQNKNKDWIINKRHILHEKLQKTDLPVILDQFVQDRIFSLDILETLMSYWPDKPIEASYYFIEKVIENISRGSFKCLMSSLRNTKDFRRFQHLIQDQELKQTDLKDSIPQVVCQPVKSELQDGQEDSMGDTTITINFKTPNGKELCEKVQKNFSQGLKEDFIELLGLYPEGTSDGSVVIHLKSLDAHNKYVVKTHIMNGDFTQLLEKVFNKANIQECIKNKKIKVDVTLASNKNQYTSVCTLSDKFEKPSVITLNKSFLIEELDIHLLVKAFEGKKIHCFSEISSDANREVKAAQFLEVLESRNLINEFLNILQEHKFTFVYNRLQRSKDVYSADSFIVRQNIVLYYSDIIKELQIDDIRNIFIDRGIFSSDVFDDIEKQNPDNSRQLAVILTKIMESGTYAVLTLVDVLYIYGSDDLANKLMYETSASYQENGDNGDKNTRKGYSHKCQYVKNAALMDALLFEASYELQLCSEDVRQPPIASPPSPVDQSFRDDIKAWKTIRNETIHRLERLERELRSANENIKTAHTVRNWSLSLLGGLIFAPFTGGGSLAATAVISGGTTGVIYFIEMFIEKDVLETTQEGINRDKAETIRLRTRIASYQGGHKRTEIFVQDLGGVALDAILLLSQNPLLAFIASFVDNNSMSVLKAIDKVISLRIQLDIELKQVEEVEGRFY